MDTPSAQESGLKVKIDKHLNLDINTLTLDFDAEKSILQLGDIKSSEGAVRKLHILVRGPHAHDTQFSVAPASAA